MEIGFTRYATTTTHALGLPTAAGNLVWYLGFFALLVAMATLTRSPAPWATWPKWQWRGLSLIDVSGIVTVVVVLYHNALAALADRIQHGLVTMPATFPLVGGVLLGPLVEEWIFRHVLWNMLDNSSSTAKARWTAALLTSAAFAAWHLPFNPQAPLMAHFWFGCAMAYARAKTGSMAVPYVIHALANAVFLLSN